MTHQPPPRCETCNGAGQRLVRLNGPAGQVAWIDCTSCNGKGTR